MAERYMRNPRIVERNIRGERILVPVADKAEVIDSIYTLNETAALVWEKASEGLSDDDIAACLCETYEVTPEHARNDTRRTVKELLQIKALFPAKDASV